MRFKKVFVMLLACAVLTSSLGAYAQAAETDTRGATLSMERASGRFSIDIPGNTFARTSRTFSLEAGETVTINASYSPRSASVDFGIIAPNGLFYSVNAANGTIDYTFEVDQRGSYTLAVWNNSSQTVSVSGYVNY